MPLTLINEHEILIPAGTLKTAPVINTFVNDNSVIERVSWVFPSGCNGVVGIQVGAKNVPIFPVNPTHWFIRSGSTDSYTLDGMPTAGDWSIIAYNTGSFDHTVHVAFTYHRPEQEAPIPGYLVADLVGTLRGGY